ncbi:hypothetical protein D3C71_2195770 [compost metagenome]
MVFRIMNDDPTTHRNNGILTQCIEQIFRKRLIHFVLLYLTKGPPFVRLHLKK